eukprot:TRINITY_DN40393_c0_g1_i1.p1 TRINITY_DN40393_c0_g1~~TRINITY_DN40393_c0_g1_i1.p1  ORF type:complete len:470 (-),score=43.76 TRINITY_DN40393_c0_g1_i1:254-1663(-)
MPDTLVESIDQRDGRQIYVGVYPRGFAQQALTELSLVRALVVDHHEAHCVVLFRLARQARCAADNADDSVSLKNDDSTCVETLGTFIVLFQAIGKAVELPPAAALSQVTDAASGQIRANADAWRAALRAHATWRCTVHRFGSHAFRSPDIVNGFADVLSEDGVEAVSPDAAPDDHAQGSKAALPYVNLDSYEVEVVVLLSDGLDSILLSTGKASRRELRSRPGASELLLLGIRRTDDAHCRVVDLQLGRGDAPRADTAVAMCTAYRMAEALRESRAAALHEGVLVASELPRVLTVLDPMCGVGTYLLALQWVHQNRALLQDIQSLELIGSDQEVDSISWAMRNASTSACSNCTHAHAGVVSSFFAANSRDLPLAECSVDLIVVDPPWGQRHGTHTEVKRGFPRWAREWARVLRPGGLAVIVTITTVLLERVCAEMQERRDGPCLEVVTSMPFDNKGWGQCRLYVTRRCL